MTPELAEHISLLAAPIYAAMLAPYYTANTWTDKNRMERLRKQAIAQAEALWLQTLDTPASVV